MYSFPYALSLSHSLLLSFSLSLSPSLSPSLSLSLPLSPSPSLSLSLSLSPSLSPSLSLSLSLFLSLSLSFPTVSPDGSVEIDPEFIILTNGSNVTFTCSARGGPNNTFVWTRSNATESMVNETELMSLLAMIPIDLDDFLDVAGPLIIENGTELALESINATRDGGNYSCVVINEAGISTVETTLYVAPAITLDPEDQLVTEGDSFSLSCLADAFPSPTYQWERMNRTSRYFEEISGKTYSDLSFSNVGFDEFGMYRCVASSEGINETAISRAALVTG